jgi:hypothetical protein
MVLRRFAAVSLAMAVMMVSLAGLSAPAEAQTRGGTHAYLLRGFMNLSFGMDDLAASLRRRGIPTSVANHIGWSTLAQEAIADYRAGRMRSAVVLGHSIGGSAALSLASELVRARVPVRLVVTLDATGVRTAPNDLSVINVYLPDGYGTRIQGSRVRNIRVTDPKVGHYTMIAALERQLIGYVLGGAAPAPSGHHARAETAPH